MNGRFYDNPDRSRFEYDIAGQIAFANYQRTDGGLVIYHVESPAQLRGRGVASALMQNVVGVAKSEKRELIPLCGYASRWVRLHGAKDAGA